MKWIYKREIIPAIIFTLIVLTFAWIYNTNEKDSYRQRGIVTKALVTGYEYDYRGRLVLNYEFHVGLDKIDATTSFPELKGGAEKMVMNKYFPVIYLKDDFTKNELLLSTKGYDRLSMKIPDSLTWLKVLERKW